MKKHISFFILFSLSLSSVQPAYAFSLSEQAAKVKEQAIALAKKGGAKSKELWHKINFLNAASKKEEKAAQRLTDCLHHHCKEVIYESPHLRTPICASKNKKFKECRACRKLNCGAAYKRFLRAYIYLAQATSIVALLISTATFASLTVGYDYLQHQAAKAAAKKYKALHGLGD